MSGVVVACGVIVLGVLETLARQKHQAQPLEIVPGKLVEGQGAGGPDDGGLDGVKGAPPAKKGE